MAGAIFFNLIIYHANDAEDIFVLTDNIVINSFHPCSLSLHLFKDRKERKEGREERRKKERQTCLKQAAN